HDVGNLLVFRLDVARHHGDGEKVVGGNVEEALNLAGVQVHGQNPVGTCLCDEICHQLGRNGRATGSPAVLSGVAEIGDDGSNAPRRRPSERIDHDQQFHQVVVGRIGRRLQDKDVLASHILLNFDEDFLVGEAPYAG